jgi:IMP cyclohydrolase
MQSLKQNPYPGRGIILGGAASGLVAAYFLTGRSENSRNRIFIYKDGVLKTVPIDESKVSNPELIIYNALKTYKNKTIITNGSQTDAIFDYLSRGKTFEEALAAQTYEPDAPNFTPRISGIADENGYALSVIKKDSAGVNRNFFYYQNIPGAGRLIHTYQGDGNPLPSFEGEPRPVKIPPDINEFAETLWESLNAENKICLFVKYAGEGKTAMMNGRKK